MTKPRSESAVHLHRCNYRRFGGYVERCQQMFECSDSCVEDEQETEGFCPEHERLAYELEAIINDL